MDKNKNCLTCNDKYFIMSNDKNGNDELQKCDNCNFFESDKQVQLSFPFPELDADNK